MQDTGQPPLLMLGCCCWRVCCLKLHTQQQQHERPVPWLGERSSNVKAQHAVLCGAESTAVLGLSVSGLSAF